MGRNLAAGFDLFQVRNNFIESDFSTETSGAGLRLGFPVSENNRLRLRYVVRRETLQPDDSLCSGPDAALLPICGLESTTWLSLFGYTLTSDHRDDFLEPSRGYYMNIQQDLAGLGGDIHFLRTEIDARWYYSPFRRGFLEDFIFSLRGAGGYIFDWGSDGRLRPNDRFYKGGASFRGFEPAGVGPRSDITSNALGGRMYAIGTGELGFPMPTPEELGLDAALFVDFGTVGLLTDGDIGGVGLRSFVHDDLTFRSSVGLSVFWDSPFGPVRLDFARVLSRERYDQTEAFRFSGGTRF